SPAWMPTEINYTREYAVATDVVESLPAPESLPDPVEVLDESPLMRAAALASEGADYQPKTLSNVVTIISPLVLADADDVASSVRPGLEANASEFLASEPEVARLVEESSDAELAEELASEARELRDEIEDQLGG